ncbi:MAG: serine protease [Gammaproteobacteria bacterium]|nr:serine protease [Gammaproteobacteria bacterium]
MLISPLNIKNIDNLSFKTCSYLIYLVVILSVGACTNAPQEIGVETTKITEDEARLVNTKLTSPWFFSPWAAALAVNFGHDFSVEKKNLAFCGATLLSDRWAITAAHCVIETKANVVFLLKANETSLFYGNSRLNDTRTAVVNKIIVHPDYDLNTHSNDIALVNIDPVGERFPNRFPRIGALPPKSRESVNLRINGWGASTPFGLTSDALLQIDSTRVSNELCNSPDWYDGRITPSMFCAKAKLPNVVPCRGFGGSGLIRQSDFGVPVIVGVVSWGDSCGRPNKPIVYVRVSRFYSWIIASTEGQI